MEEFLNLMMPDSHPSINTVSTLVFMDLEATGLPSLEGKKNVHITEMSLVAVDRTSFETDNTLRVLNKLSLCIRPRSTISPTAMAITGLYNDVLEKQEKFDDSIPKLLEYFFRRLRRPLCLLAHNGKRYDFPLLQAELKNINYALDPEILCADTLEAFRSIITDTNVAHIDSSLAIRDEKTRKRTNDSNVTDCFAKKERKSLSDDEMDKLLSNDIDLFRTIEEPSTPNTIQCNSISGTTPLQIFPFQDELTTPKSKTAELAAMPRCRKKSQLDPTWLPKNQYKGTTPRKFNHIQAKRQLFQNGNAEIKPNSKPTRFSLEELYCHYFGEKPPKSHYAEADCIALSKVCQKINQDFLKWIDEHCTSFSETSAMW